MQANKIIVTRAIIGLTQGFLLYLLYMSLTHKVWPATDAYVLQPLLFIALFVPLIITMGLNNLRNKILLYWASLATVIIGFLCFYDAWRNKPTLELDQYFFPSFLLFFLLIFGLYIAHVLIVAGYKDKAFQAQYSTYFDISWKIALQILLSLSFLGAFWLSLWAGAALFNVINLKYFSHLIQKSWFAIPATTLVFNLGLHVTDIRLPLIRDVRTLILTLFSWLLPILTLLVSAFLVALLFTNFSLLWTEASLLITTTALLVILINTAYQDGKVMPSILAFVSPIACLILLPITILAFFALSHLTEQQGLLSWTVFLTVSLCILLFYSLGYAYYSFRLKNIENWNFYAAFLTLGAILSLLTPLADPFRLSVNSQIKRLNDGQVSPESFNYRYLRWETGRYGFHALELLKESDNEAIRLRANSALAEKKRYAFDTKEYKESKLILHDKIPPTFTNQKWTETSYYYSLPTCLNYGTNFCDIWMKTIDGKGSIIVLENRMVYVFQAANRDSWDLIGTYTLPDGCKKIFDKAQSGAISFHPPLNPFPDLEILGYHFHFNQTITDKENCPQN